MKAVFGVVVVVVQIQTSGAQIHFIRLVCIANFCGQNAVNARTQRAFMNGELFVKFEIADMGIGIEIVFKK